MNYKKLDMHGFSHGIMLGLFAVIFAIGGVAYLVGTHAATACPFTSTSPAGVTTSTTCPPIPHVPTSTSGSYTFIGRTTPQGSNETISAYACVTKLSNTEWVTTGLFKLSSSYKQPAGFNWIASIINNGTTPLPNNQAIYQNFVDDATAPAAVVTIFSNPQGENPLSFSYSAGTATKGGTTLAGNLAQNIHPVNLTTCAAPPPSS